MTWSTANTPLGRGDGRDALAGETTVRDAIEGRKRHPNVRSWLSVAASAAQHTAGIEGSSWRLQLRIRMRTWPRSSLGVLPLHGEMALLVSEPFEPPIELVAAVARLRDKAAEAGYRIAESLDAPLDDELTRCFARRPDDRG